MAQPKRVTVAPTSRIDDTIFGPVKPSNAFEETFERLLQAIKLGIVGYGDRLPSERDLAARLTVSRVTLREAIRALKQVGYLESRRGHGGGTFVTYRPDQSRGDHSRQVAGRFGGSLPEVLKFRHVIEPGAVDLAARQQLTETQTALLRKLLAEVLSAPTAEFLQADSRFHLGIAELTGSTMVTRAVAEVRMHINEFLFSIPLLDPPVAHSNDQHEEMVEAILNHDPETARRVMQLHIDATGAMLRGFLGSPSTWLPQQAAVPKAVRRSKPKV